MFTTKLFRKSFLALLFTAFSISGGNAQEASFKAPSEPEVVPGQFIVKYREGVNTAAGIGILESMNVKIVDDLPAVGAQIIEVAPSAAGEISTLSAEISAIAYTEPVYRVYALGQPNDPRYSNQWGFEKINAPTAWDTRTDASDVVVAVIDTGIDYRHPDLAANMWKNPGEIPDNGIDDDNNGIIDDVFGAAFVNNTASGDPLDDNRHGTHVAGTIGAVTDNALGVAGTSWKVKLMAVKFLSGSGSGTTADAVRAIDYAVRMKAQILNNSWGGGGFSRALEDVIKESHDKGTLFVAAAGNNGRDNDTTPHYPSDYDVPNVISVLATDDTDTLANFSNFGKESADLSAPGVSIDSTLPEGTYGSLSGTSMATPHVAGAAALVLAENPGMSALDLKKRLFDTSDKIPALAPVSTTGGRLNLAAALSDGGDDPVDPDPEPPVEACEPGSARIAYNHFNWPDKKTISDNSNLLGVTFTLDKPMIVDISGNTSARKLLGNANTLLRTGFYNQPSPNTMWTPSYRRLTFEKNGIGQTVSSSMTMKMAAGEHTVYWKIWTSNADVRFDSGHMSVRAFQCDMSGQGSANLDDVGVTEADTSTD